MARYRVFTLVVMVIIASLASACGGGDNPEPPAVPTVDSVAQSVNQTVAAIAVAQTVAALTGSTATPIAPPPAATQGTVEQAAATAESVSEQPSPVAGAATDTQPAEAPPSCTTIAGVNFRSGPGTAYEPPLGTLPGGAVLIPISYVARGFPQGEWLQVQIANTGQTAWVSAGAQFVRCTVNPSSLPVSAAVPPTPRPTATPTPLPPTATPTRVVEGVPPNVINDIPSGACERTQHIISVCEYDPNHLFRVFARDERAGENDGDGIDYVRFTIFDETGQVYQNTERNAAYCIFQGGEPNCNNWPANEFGQYTWGVGGPVVKPGTYQVFIEVVSNVADPATESNVCNWNFDMTISLP